MMKLFAKNLIKYRKRNGLTQAQLAEKINVTPQAISKWENRSLPDCEILPTLAKTLGVPIDALFSNEDEKRKESPEKIVNNMIRNTPPEERADIIMQLIYAVFGAYTNYQKSKVTYPENLELETYAEIRTDYEMALTRLNEDLKYCCFMKIPEDGLFPYVQDSWGIVKLFEVLADVDAIKLICYLGSGKRNRMQSVEFMAMDTGIPLDRVKKIIDRLDGLGIVWRVAIDSVYSDNKESPIVYGYVNSTPLTFILVLAKSLTQYIVNHDINIDSWQHGPFHMPDIKIDKPVKQVDE